MFSVWAYDPGDVFLSMLWFGLFIWVWLLIAVFADVFRSGVQSVAGTTTAGERERLTELQPGGAITDADFQQATAKLLA